MDDTPRTEVLEATPTQRRRRRSWVLVLLACVMFAFVLIALPGYAWLTSRRGAERVSAMLTQRVIENGNTRLRFGKVLALRGSRLVVADVRLDYRVDDVWRPAVSSSQVSVKFGGLLFWGDTHLAIDADSLAVTVWQDSTGQWRYPQFGTGAPTKPGAAPNPLRADVVARHGTLTLRGPQGKPLWQADDLGTSLHYDNLRRGAPASSRRGFALRDAGRDEWLGIDSLTARAPGGGRYRLDGAAWIGAVRQIDKLQLRGPHLALDGRGVVATTGRADSVLLDARIDSLAALGRAAGRPLPDAGWRGAVTLVRRGGRLAVTARGTGRFEDARGDSLRVVATRSSAGVWHVDEAGVRVPGGTTLAALSGDIDPRRHTAHVRVRGDLDAPSLPGAVTRRVKLPVMRSRGVDASFDGSWTGRFTTVFRAGATEIEGRPVIGLEGQAVVDSGLVRLTAATIHFAGADVVTAGTVLVKGTVLDLPYTATITDLGAFAGVFGIPGPLGGSGTAAGRASGPLSVAELSASGMLRAARFLDIHADAAHITDFVAAFGGHQPRVHLLVDAGGVSFAGQRAPHATASIDALGNIADAAFRVQGSRADTLITGHSHSESGLTTVAIDTARVMLAGEAWTAAAPGIHFTTLNGRTNVAALRVLAAHGGEVRSSRLVFGPGDRVDGAFTLDDVPVATPIREGDAVYWRGRLRGDVRLAGVMGNPEVRLHLGAHTDSASANIALTDMSVWCDIAGRVARLDSLSVRAGSGGDVRGAGVFSYAPGVPESLLAQRWGALAQIACDARIWTDDLDLATWTGGIRQLAVPLGGRLTAQMQVRGVLAQPDLSLRSAVRGFSAREFVSDSLVAVGRWVNGGALAGQVMVDSLVLHTGAERVVARGTVPASLRLPGGVVLGSAGLDVVGDVPSLDMAILPALLPVLGDASGRLSGHVALRGDPHAPDATGDLHVRDGSLRGFGREELVQKISGDVAIDGHGLQITSLTGEQGEGRVSLTGSMRWARGTQTRYDFRADLRNFWVNQPAMFNGHVSGILHLVRDSDAPTMFTPKLTGSAHVDDARIVYEFNQNTGTDPALVGVYQVPTPAMTFDLHLTGERNILLANRDASIELQLDVQASLDYAGIPGIVGTLTLTRGYYTFLDTRFSDVKGTVTFTAGQINPDLDITASAKIRHNQQPSTVLLTLSGKQLTPDVGLTDKGHVMSKDEIVKALTYGKLTDTSRQGTASSQYVQNVAGITTNVLIRQIERSVLRDTGLLDVFDVDNTSGQERISVGKYLANELFVNYQQGLTTSDADFSIEYWLTNRILLHGQYTRTTQDATATPGASTQQSSPVRVGIRARKEF